MANTNNNILNSMSRKMPVNPVRMILERRRSPPNEHSDEDIKEWVNAYTNGDLPDYQMSAWLMTVCFHPLSDHETATLTRCMVESGETVTWNDSENLRLVDKHSTGGVGDKVSIVLAPLVASFESCAVPMMAGRGLGHTGGTIDKLESIPGFRTDLGIPEFQDVVRTVGCAIVAAGPNLCPADRKLYALRDVTGTVSSLPLQTASIMCKKIAENPESLLLDCKYGRGAFQATAADAEALAMSMISTGEANGLTPTTAFLTNMDAPLGFSVGNFLEVEECIDIMKGNLVAQTTSKDLISLVVLQATQMLVQSDSFPNKTFDEVCEMVFQQLDSGNVLNKFVEMVEAQGGDTSVILSPNEYPTASTVLELISPCDGFVAEIDALTIGEVSVDLGAGRRLTSEPVDFRAGLKFRKKVGSEVSKGDVIATLHTCLSDEIAQAALALAREAVVIGDSEPTLAPFVSHVVTSQGATEFIMPKILAKLN